MTQLSTRSGVLPDLLGALEITADDGEGSPGSTVIVRARVTNLCAQQVQIVLLVQGLPASWSPPAQVLLLPAGDAADVFLHLRPALGTPLARYPWALTAETANHPMQAVTAELLVRREPATTGSTRRRSRRRPWILPAAAAGLLAVIAVSVVVLTHHYRSPTPELVPPSVVAPSRPTPSSSSPGGGPAAHPTSLPVALTGTILAGEVGLINVTVIRFNLYDLNDETPASDTSVPAGIGGSGVKGVGAKTTVKAKVKIKGKQWTTTLPAGIYGMTFTQAGHEPASIVVDTAIPSPEVQLQAVLPPASGEKEGNGDQSP